MDTEQSNSEEKKTKRRKPEGMYALRLLVRDDIKNALMDKADSEGVPLSEYLRPVIHGLARGEIEYKVVDNRGGKAV